MDLRNYLFKNRIKQTDFAKKCHCSKATINHVCNGKRPSKPLAQSIHEATQGVVTYPDILKQE